MQMSRNFTTYLSKNITYSEFPTLWRHEPITSTRLDLSKTSRVYPSITRVIKSKTSSKFEVVTLLHSDSSSNRMR